MNDLNKGNHMRRGTGAKRQQLTVRLNALRERTRILEEALHDYTDTHFRVCIFGSARIKPEDEIYKITHRIGHLLGERGIDVLTGGGPGLMEAANKGVLEGQAISGSKIKSFGITIALNKFEDPSEHIDIKHHHKKFSSRLDDFMRLSHACIFVPGGIGTLLELYFSWQLLQVGHIPDRPIILVGTKFWTGMLEWMKKTQIDGGLVSPGDTRWVSIVDSPEEVIALLEKPHNEFLERRAALGVDYSAK